MSSAPTATHVHTLVMVRHGESSWNLENKFCGWVDADLSGNGVREARMAGQRLREGGFTFDIAFTSVLKRAIKTLYHVQDELDLHWIPVVRNWRLNERMYGCLQGLNKSEMAAKHGEAQVKIWRRSYDAPPPPVDVTSEFWVGHDPKYRFVDKQLIPTTECLKDVVTRAMPFWHDVIAPEIMKGQRVLILAHGTAVRAIVKYLDDISDTEITTLNIPTGIPLVYELDDNLRPIRHYYLASDEQVKEATDKIAAQGKAKIPS